MPVKRDLVGIDTVLDEHCDNIGTRVPGLTLVVFLLGIALPVVAVVIIYVHIVIVIVRKLHFMAKSSNLDEVALARSQHKMMGIVSVILAVWLLCWGPLLILMLIYAFQRMLNTEHVNSIQFIIMYYSFAMLGYCNSLFNPILYFITSHDFRKAGYELCKCMSHGSQNEPDTASSELQQSRKTMEQLDSKIVRQTKIKTLSRKIGTLVQLVKIFTCLLEKSSPY